MTRPVKFAFGALCLLVCVIVARPVVLNIVSKSFLNTGPNGVETPATVGLAFDRLKIPSSGRVLDSYLVRAPAACQPRIAVLIFHGIMETISEWVPGQKFLYDHCISSLVFDYSGHGDSTQPRNHVPRQCRRNQRLCNFRLAISWRASLRAGPLDGQRADA